MILTKISELTAMTAEMTSALLSVIARHAAQPRHALLCMLSLVQKQRETINLLPEQAIRAIEVYDDLPAMLNVLASKFDASQFLQLVLKGVLARKNFALLHELVDALHLDDMTIGSLVDATLDRVASGDLETDSEDSATIKTLFTKLQARHATVVDTVLKERLADASSMDSATTSSTLFNFITSAFRGTRHEFIEDAQTTLVLGLCHPEAAVRRIAVAKVIATLNKGVSNNCSDAAFMSLALVNNLGSDDDMIVENVLRFERLVDVADPNELVRALVKLVQSRRALEIRQAAVAVLCSKRLLEDARNAALVDGALLRVVLTTEVDNKIAMTMTKTIAEASKDGLQSAVLSALASVQRSDNILEINRAMVYSIASSESIDTKSLLSIRTPLSILSLLERLSLVTQADEKLTLVKQILDQLDTSSAVAADRAASVDSSSVPDVEPILLGASSANAAYVAVYALRRIIVESIAAPAPIAWMSQDAEVRQCIFHSL